MNANVIPAVIHEGSIWRWSPSYEGIFTTFLHFWPIFIILRTSLLIIDFFYRLIRGAESPMMLKSGSFSSTCTLNFSNNLLHTSAMHTPQTHTSHPGLHPAPHFHPHSVKMKHTQHRNHTPPRPKSAYHTRPRHASHVPLRQGARHWAPHPHLLCAPPGLSMPPSSIHHICPPASITFPTKASNPKKRKGKKEGRSIQPLPCRTVLAGEPAFVPSPASPRLDSPANTPSSPGEQQPRSLGGGTEEWCYLKQYSLAPSMAPWSPADSVCWAVKRCCPGPPLRPRLLPLGGSRGPEPLTEGPTSQGSLCSTDLTTDALWSGTVRLRWGGGLSTHLQRTFKERWIK